MVHLKKLWLLLPAVFKKAGVRTDDLRSLPVFYHELKTEFTLTQAVILLQSNMLFSSGLLARALKVVVFFFF